MAARSMIPQRHSFEPLLAAGLALVIPCVANQAVIRVTPTTDIQVLADSLKPGDTLQFAPGTYRQPLRISAKGTKSKPIRLLGSRDTIFNGLAELNLEWTPHRDGIHRAKVARPVTQLFLDGQPATPARWPDMKFSERWDNTRWPAADKGSSYGTMVDADLASSGLDFTGCMAVLNIGSWQTFRRPVTGHGKGRDRFSYPTDPGSRLVDGKHPPGMDRYCIYGRAALDAPGEWFFDRASSTLFLYPPEGKSPGQFTIESKQFAEALVVEDSKHLTISGFQFRGTTIRVENSDHCTLENIEIEFGSAIVDPFGPNRPHPSVTERGFSARKWFGETSVDTLTEVHGDDNVIRNITARFSEGPALTVRGSRNLVENCLFRDIDWHGLDYGFGIDLLAAAHVTVRRVTLDHCGGSEGLRLPNHGPSLVEYCHLHHCGLRQSDGAIIQTSTAGAAGTEIRYNWIHDQNAFHWGGNGIRGDDGTRGLLIHHNVVWNCREKGIVTKGDHNRVHHNTCFDNPGIDILVPRNRLPGKTKELTEQNRHSAVQNNIGQVTGSWIWEKPKQPPYGHAANNLDAGSEILRNPPAHDFRLKPGSPAIDAGSPINGFPGTCHGKAPDLGAHESGAENWSAGYQR